MFDHKKSTILILFVQNLTVYPAFGWPPKRYGTFSHKKNRILHPLFIKMVAPFPEIPHGKVMIFIIRDFIRKVIWQNLKMQENYQKWEVEEIIINQLRCVIFLIGSQGSQKAATSLTIIFRPLSLEDLQSGLWHADVCTFLMLQNREYLGKV